MSYLPLLVILVALAAMVYFMMIRPLRQREKQHDRLVMELEVGDTVITAGGIFGKVERIDEGSLVLIVESGTKLRVTTGAIIKKE
ncbi:preprotein translocase subunit YajC [Chloroflexota bacterium]